MATLICCTSVFLMDLLHCFLTNSSQTDQQTDRQDFLPIGQIRVQEKLENV